MSTYKDISNEIYQNVGQAIGIHVFLLVIERSIWKTKEKYEEADLIQYSESGISLDKLDEIDPERAEQVSREFVLAVIATLGRLVGKQLASQLTEQINNEIS